METKMADQEQTPVQEEQGEAPVQEQTEAPAAEPSEQAAPAAEEGAPAAEEGDTTPAETQQAEDAGEAQVEVAEESAEMPADGQTAAKGDTAAEGQVEQEGETQANEGEAQAQDEGAEGEGAEQQVVDGEEKPEGEEGQETVEGEAAASAEQDGEAPEGEQQPEAEGEEGEVQAQEGEVGAGDGEKSPVPQSDTFEDGERTESPVAVGQKLSRGGSPIAEEQEEQIAGEMSPPVPGTPDGEMEDDEEEEEYDEEEEEEEYEEEEPAFVREELIEKYHQALAERQQLQDQNYQLQHKLAEYFRKKKSDDTRQDMDKNVTDQEQRYLKYMANLDELRRQDTEEREMYKIQIEELKDRCAERQDRVNDERLKFMEFKKQIALGAVNSRSGKPIPQKDVETYLATENRKESEVVNVRLENIKLKNKLKKKEMQLKSKEELAEGLHLIDFEQLKIENQTYNEKIEERNEELLKLRKKITSTVQVLTHLKEKLQFVQGENSELKGTLREVEEQAGRKRDILSRTKQARDGLRIDNQKLRQNCGLLGNESLLRDFEERKDEGDDLRSKLEELRILHAELTLNLNGVRRKIDQAKVTRS